MYARRSNDGAIWRSALREIDGRSRHVAVALPGAYRHSAEPTKGAVAGAVETLRRALASPRSPGVRDGVAGQAAALLAHASAIRGRFGAALDSELYDAVAQRLERFEQHVLEGERTYEVGSPDAEESAAVAVTALELLDSGADRRLGTLLAALDKSVVELAAVLVRAAGNMEAEGRAGDATQHCPVGVRSLLGGIVVDVSSAARRLSDATHPTAPDDHLGAALRLALRGEAGRAEWLELGTREYLAARALDALVPDSTYERYYGGLDAAVAAGSANLLCAARLLGRPQAFRLGAAWARQAVGLRYAQSYYTAGLDGDREAFGVAQLVVVTRLIRAVTAVAALDLQQGGGASSNGAPA